MTAVHVVDAPEGPELRPLPLRMPRASGVIDPESFRARARGEGPAMPEPYFPSRGLRTVHLPPAAATDLLDVDGPALTLVITGSLTAAGKELGPGSALLTDGPEVGSAVSASGDCRLVQLLLDTDFPGPKARPVGEVPPRPREEQPLRVLRMVEAADERSSFHDFPELFAGPPGAWSPVVPVAGLRFMEMADLFFDWHPEVVNAFVVVLAGALELEVGAGTERVELFHEGDVCLAQDRTGVGHIDRAGEGAQVAIIVLADQDLWPLTCPEPR